MSLESPKSAARVFTLDDLSQTLDRQAKPIPARPIKPPLRPAANQWPTFLRRVRDYGLSNWAQRWQAIVYGTAVAEAPAEPADTARPVIPDRPVVHGVIAAGALAIVLVLIGMNLQTPESPVAVAPPPQPVAVAAPFRPDPAAEINGLVEDLVPVPDDRPNPQRVPKLLAANPPPAEPADGDCMGTAIHFVPTRAAASKRAEQSDRLLFILNVSGDFEDNRFT